MILILYQKGLLSHACVFEVEVRNFAIKPRYAMTCSGTKVYGEYYEEQVLDGSHYIEVVLSVETTSFGATYEIETNEVYSMPMN